MHLRIWRSRLMRHRDLTLLKRIRRPVGYDRTTVGGIDESVPRDDGRPPPDGPITVQLRE